MPLSTLKGNRALKEQLQPRLSGGALGHALIVSGPAGSGKHTLAAILSRAMVCTGTGTKPCGSCPACKKALAGIHPDIITVAPLEEGKQITVDQVRQMRADAHIRPNEAPRKVYVIEQADQLRSEAQNAMLKLLEEGPAYAAFILIAENPGGLLITVRSRCETFSLVGEDQDPTQEDQELIELANVVSELWLAGKERELMEHCANMEKWDRQQFADLTRHMTARFTAELPTAVDKQRILRGIQLLERLRQAAALNVGSGPLAGRLCASAGEQIILGGS